jgi:hypothetical protein
MIQNTVISNDHYQQWVEQVVTKHSSYLLQPPTLLFHWLVESDS